VKIPTVIVKLNTHEINCCIYFCSKLTCWFPRGSPVCLMKIDFTVARLAAGSQDQLFINGGSVFLECNNVFLTPQLRQWTCVRFVRATRVSHSSCSKDAEFLYWCRVRVTRVSHDKIYTSQKSPGSQHVKQELFEFYAQVKLVLKVILLT
jgi:hypothetical protein